MKLRRPFSLRLELAVELGTVGVIVALLYVFKDRNPIGVLVAFVTVSVAACMLIGTIRGILDGFPKPDQIPKPLPPDASEGRDG
ncbi:hypothetical protein [Bosea sp. BH3]|uniref:hypothetical protein n=1 Tax=Bosea sp. BH3 TaxID=2871701 RepID=UPI0021CB5A10|nr:hypothetical protein [Bosea sp. BH3]MCU4178134.1 hypothetical protein [Bosea sp. BH3]